MSITNRHGGKGDSPVAAIIIGICFFSLFMIYYFRYTSYYLIIISLLLMLVLNDLLRTDGTPLVQKPSISPKNIFRLIAAHKWLSGIFLAFASGSVIYLFIMSKKHTGEYFDIRPRFQISTWFLTIGILAHLGIFGLIFWKFGKKDFALLFRSWLTWNVAISIIVYGIAAFAKTVFVIAAIYT